MPQRNRLARTGTSIISSGNRCSISHCWRWKGIFLLSDLTSLKQKRLNLYSTQFQLAGLIEPNDGQCHLNEAGEYTHSSIFDYPSIPHINLKAKENVINIIFAVTKDQNDIYKILTRHIEGSSSANLDPSSSNIVELIKDEYNVR